MKVCVLQTVLDPFKGGNHLPLLAACPDTQFTIICNRSKVKESDLPANVSVVTVPARIGSYYYGFSDFLFARSILKRFAVNDPFWKQFDVIHLNQVMGPALRKLKQTGVHLLLLIHHPVTADREVAVAESSLLQGLVWRLKYMALVHFQSAMCRRASRIATVSQTMSKRIASDYRIDPENISVVPNGVDGDQFALTPDAECTYDVIALGSFIHPRKGFRYLLEVYTALAASGKKIADVGRRSDAQRKALESIDGVTVHNMVDSDTLINLVRTSRVLVSTSLFEGFGLSLIEALACGHPCIAFGVGAVPEVLGSIDPTLVVPSRDTAATIRAVEQYLSLTPQERDAKGRLYRSAVLEQYSLIASANALQALYTN